MKTYLYILFVFGFLSLNSCLEAFEFTNTELPNVIVIDGAFTSQKDPHFVRLRQVSPYGEGPGKAITSADLRIIDDLGEVGYYLETEDGLYMLSQTQMTGQVGRTYVLEITLIDGTILKSKPQTILPRIEADSAYHQFDDSNLRVFIDTPVPTDEEVFFRWSHDEVYSFVTQPCNPFNNTSTCYIQVYPIAQRFYTSSNRGLDINRFEARQVIYDPGIAGRPVEFRNIHFYNVYQRRIDEATFDYWNQIDQLLNQQGTIFDPTPATIAGNIYNPENPEDLILGYFEVSSVDTVRTFVTVNDVKEKVNGYLSYCPNITFYYNYLYLLQIGMPPPDECCSCSAFNNLIQMPDYF